MILRISVYCNLLIADILEMFCLRHQQIMNVLAYINYILDSFALIREQVHKYLFGIFSVRLGSPFFKQICWLQLWVAILVFDSLELNTAMFKNLNYQLSEEISLELY